MLIRFFINYYPFSYNIPKSLHSNCKLHSFVLKHKCTQNMCGSALEAFCVKVPRYPATETIAGHKNLIKASLLHACLIIWLFLLMSNDHNLKKWIRMTNGRKNRKEGSRGSSLPKIRNILSTFAWSDCVSTSI